MRVSIPMAHQQAQQVVIVGAGIYLLSLNDLHNLRFHLLYISDTCHSLNGPVLRLASLLPLLTYTLPLKFILNTESLFVVQHAPYLQRSLANAFHYFGNLTL